MQSFKKICFTLKSLKNLTFDITLKNNYKVTGIIVIYKCSILVRSLFLNSSQSRCFSTFCLFPVRIGKLKRRKPEEGQVISFFLFLTTRHKTQMKAFIFLTFFSNLRLVHVRCSLLISGWENIRSPNAETLLSCFVHMASGSLSVRCVSMWKHNQL